MLRIDKVQTLEGLQVYSDDAEPTTFYVLPEQPRFRVDDQGRPIFRFLQYKTPRPTPDGKNGGGFVIFDVEFSVSAATESAIIDALKAQVAAAHGRPELVKLGTIQWAKGTAKINIADISNTFVETVSNPASPSLFGRNITPFTVELTQQGATLFGQALQGQGGFVQVAYAMNAWVKLPPITGTAWFNSSQFYDFVQNASDDSGWGDDTFINDISERLVSSQSMGVHMDSGMGADPKVVAQLQDSLVRTLEDTVTKKMLEAVGEYTGDRSVPEDYETVRRTFSKTKIDNFSYTISENSAALWPFNPQGTLPNITSLVDANNAPIKWSDYATLIDLDDPFFRTIRVNVRVNADLATLPIDSIDVHLSYGSTNPKIADFHFSKADDSGTFLCFQEGANKQYTYSYVVNFKGSAQAFKKPPDVSESGELTINLDDTGLLLVDIQPGNIDFKKAASALVTVKYEPHAVPPIEEQFLIDSKTAGAAKLEKAIFEKRDKPVNYEILYTMVDGKTLHSGPFSTQGRKIFVNSPFNDTRTVNFRAVGDLVGTIEAIDVDATYTDAKNGYTVTGDKQMKAGDAAFDWSFPVIDSTAGVVTYTALIHHKDGTVESIPPTPVDGSPVKVGDEVAQIVEISVLTDFIDFTKIALVKVDLRYRPDGINDAQSQDLIVRKAGTTPPTWKLEMQKAMTKYVWSATYFLLDQTTRHIAETTTSDPMIPLPAMPAA